MSWLALLVAVAAALVVLVTVAVVVVVVWLTYRGRGDDWDAWRATGDRQGWTPRSRTWGNPSGVDVRLLDTNIVSCVMNRHTLAER
jgi:hypothetical protein